MSQQYANMQGTAQDDLAKQNKSKSRHIMVLNQLKKREDNWNPRFYLDHIPCYNAVEDKYCNDYAQLPAKQKKLESVEFAPGKIRKRPTNENQGHDLTPLSHNNNNNNSQEPSGLLNPQQIQQQQQQQIQNSYKIRNDSQSKKRLIPQSADPLNEQIKSNYELLVKAWDQLSVPQNHKDIFIECLKQITKNKVLEQIQREREELSKGTSTIQSCMKAIQTREKCMQEIDNQISIIEEIQEPEMINQFKEKCSELLTHLRILTVNTVECINAWQQQFLNCLSFREFKEQANHYIPFIFKNDDYLNRIRYDNQFIFKSVLKDYFYFDLRMLKGGDPFLKSLIQNQDPKPNLISQYVSKVLQKRIETCEKILQDYLSKENQMKPPQIRKPSLGTKSKSPNPFSQKQIDDNQQQQNQQQTTQSKFNKKPLYKGGPIPIPQKRNYADQGKKFHMVNQSNQDQQSERSRQLLSEEDDDALIVSEGKSPQKEQYRKSKQNSTSNKRSEASTLEQHNQHLSSQQNTISKNEERKSNSNFPPQGISPSPKKQLQSDQQAASGKNAQGGKKNAQGSGDQDVIQTQSMLSIKPFEIYESEVLSYFQTYLEKVDQEMKQSFVDNAQDLYQRTIQEQEPSLLKILDQKRQECGLAFLNIDKNCYTQRRQFISHLTCFDKSKFEECVKSVVEFIWLNDPCEEIRVTLYQQDVAENDKVTKKVKKEIQQPFLNLGFKWKQMTNDKYSGKQSIIYGMKRPPEIMSRFKLSQPEPIIINSSVVVGKEITKSRQQNGRANFFFDISCTLLGITNSIMNEEKLLPQPEPGGQEDKQLEQSELQKELQNSDNAQIVQYRQSVEQLQAKKFKFAGLKNKKCSNNGELINLLKEVDMVFKTVNPQYEESSHIQACIMKSCYRWKSFNISQLNNLKYQRLNMEDEAVGCVAATSTSVESPIYIIPTDDESINIFIFQIDNLEVYKQNFQQQIRDVFKNIEQQTPFQGKIWVPSFSFDIEESGQPYVDNYQLTHKTTISINYESAIKNIQIQMNQQQDRCIKPPFVFGLSHNDFEETLETPYFSILIDSENCITL